MSVNALSACACIRSNYCVALTCTGTKLRDSGTVGFVVSSQDVPGLTLQTEVVHYPVQCHAVCLMFEHEHKLLIKECEYFTVLQAVHARQQVTP